jgi:hypothetical protein
MLWVSHDAALAPCDQWRGVLLHGHRIRGREQILLLLSQLEGFLCLGEGLVGVQRDILLLLHGGQGSIVGVTGSELTWMTTIVCGVAPDNCLEGLVLCVELLLVAACQA